MAAGIEDVAARAGVSTATVSRALRGLPKVSAATRRRVLVAARELDYVASATASSLASGRTSTVAVVSPYVSRWFFGQVIGAAVTVLRDAGFDLLLYTVDTSERRTRFFKELPLRRRVDAVMIVTLPLNDTEVASLAALGIPVCTVGLEVPGFSSVRIDDVAGARSAVNHLLALGHRRIAMIAGGRSEPAHFTTPDDRRTGYTTALTAAGIGVQSDWDVDGDYTVDGGEQAMASLLACPTLPTAVFAQSDEMAMGALRAIRKVGLHCPEDISVVGFDDHEMAALFDLTTVGQPVQQQGALAARRLLSALSGSAFPTSEEIPTHMIVRGTTCPPSGVESVASRGRMPVNSRRPPVTASAGRPRKNTKETA
jgi:LacI family transcriptional regulator, repressor for deo operon, udp, cdd, tsx, nupC, and nupG